MKPLTTGIMFMAELVHYSAQADAAKPTVRGPNVQLTMPMLEQYWEMRVDGRRMSEIAAVMGVSKHTIYRWRAMGRRGIGGKAYADLWLIECTVKEMEMDRMMDDAAEMASRGETRIEKSDGTWETKTTPNDGKPLLDYINTALKFMQVDKGSVPAELEDPDKPVARIVVSEAKKAVLDAAKEVGAT